MVVRYLRLIPPETAHEGEYEILVLGREVLELLLEEVGLALAVGARAAVGRQVAGDVADVEAGEGAEGGEGDLAQGGGDAAKEGDGLVLGFGLGGKGGQQAGAAEDLIGGKVEGLGHAQAELEGRLLHAAGHHRYSTRTHINSASQFAVGPSPAMDVFY